MLGVRSNQYWLFADDNAGVDIDVLRETLQAKVLDTERSKRQLAIDPELAGEETKMVWDVC